MYTLINKSDKWILGENDTTYEWKMVHLFLFFLNIKFTLHQETSGVEDKMMRGRTCFPGNWHCNVSNTYTPRGISAYRGVMAQACNSTLRRLRKRTAVSWRPAWAKRVWDQPKLHSNTLSHKTQLNSTQVNKPASIFLLEGRINPRSLLIYYFHTLKNLCFHTEIYTNRIIFFLF